MTEAEVDLKLMNLKSKVYDTIGVISLSKISIDKLNSEIEKLEQVKANMKVKTDPEKLSEE